MSVATRFSLVAVDLDGTALNDAHQLSAATYAALQTVRALPAVEVCIATGRTLASVQKYVDELRWQDVPAVCYNGAAAFLLSHGRPAKQIFSDALLPEAAHRLLAFADKHGAFAQVYDGATGEVFAVAPENELQRELMGRYAEMTGTGQTLVPALAPLLDRFASAKLLLFTPDTEALLAAARAELPPGAYNFFRGSPSPYFVEFLSPSTSKGEGLRAVCRELRLSEAAVVAFGDGENDKEFLEVAGLGIAMKNARPVAKQAADRVLEYSNEEDGVARTLRELMDQGLL